MSEHIKHVFQSKELEESSTVRKFRTVQKEGERQVTRQRVYYNLDVIIAVGYRINTKRGSQFRQWATRRLKDYLVQGYAINERSLEQQRLEVQTLKNGIRILSRVIEEKIEGSHLEWLNQFSKRPGTVGRLRPRATGCQRSK